MLGAIVGALCLQEGLHYSSCLLNFSCKPFLKKKLARTGDCPKVRTPPPPFCSLVVGPLFLTRGSTALTTDTLSKLLVPSNACFHELFSWLHLYRTLCLGSQGVQQMGGA